MTRKQAALIIFVNAVISALISLGVALWLITPNRLPSAPTPQVLDLPTQAAVVQPAQAIEAPIQVMTPATEGVAQAGTATAPFVYVVQPGDTLSSLALKFDVAGSDIMAANQIQDPDFLPAGIELIIPSGGLPQLTATWTPIPTATDTPIPFEPPSASLTASPSTGDDLTPIPPSGPLPVTGELRVEISEIVGVGVLDQERVIITNVGDRLADMQGWTLIDAEGASYVFPNFRLWTEGNVTVHTRLGQDGTPFASFFWGKLEPAWSVGEVATLKNAKGEVVATYIVGP